MQILLNKIKFHKIILFTTLILMFNYSNAQIKYELPCNYELLESSYIVGLEQIGIRTNK